MTDALPTPYQQYIHQSKYSRWRDDLGRRETWAETVDRYTDFWELRFPEVLDSTGVLPRLHSAILELDALPSMRGLMTAGPALTENECAIYNCSFLAINRPEAFDESLLLLMCGVGVGYSVERRHVSKLPAVPLSFEEDNETIVVADSKYGWATAMRKVVKSLYAGKIPRWDMSKVRPSGAILKTFGGRASGPAPLESLFRHTVDVFLKARGRQLSSVEVHSIECKIGDIVVVGGVRRSAMISIFDADDNEMRLAKSGSWFETHPYFAMANNSAVYESAPSPAQFLDDFSTLIRSQAGEPGFFNRRSAQGQAARWGKRPYEIEYGTNPCFTGDTLVAVADGRGAIRFDELARTGEDVPVYTRTRLGAVVVRTMRSPRKTGHKTVYSVRFTDGTVVKATADHPFVRVDGSVETTHGLTAGDRLAAMTRYAATYDEVFKDVNSRSQEYWWIDHGRSSKHAEHRLIAAYTLERPLRKGEIVHHADRDALNNDLDNLVLMSRDDHYKLHASDMMGNNNPARRCMSASWRANLSSACKGALNGNASRFDHDEVFAAAVTLTRELGRVPEIHTWKKYARAHDLPENFNKWRKSHLGSLSSMLRRAAAVAFGEVQIPPGTDLRVVRRLYNLIARGYDAFVQDGVVVVRKHCEICSGTFVTRRLEHGICSQECARRAHPEKYAQSQRNRSSSQRQTLDSRRERTRESQISVFLSLPHGAKKSAWVAACKKRGVSAEISRSSSPFRSWSELRAAASVVNHVVESVTMSGIEDVYDGTVDEHHALYVGSDAYDDRVTTESGRQKMTFVCALQCGEILLRDRQFCNLSQITVRPRDTKQQILEKLEVATILGTLQSTLTNFKHLSPEWRRNCEEERLLGVSMTGNPSHALLNGSRGLKRLGDFLEEAREHVWEVNARWAQQLGVSPAAASTCLKPAGNSSQLTGTESPLKEWHDHKYVRRTRGSKTDPVTKLLQDQGVPWEDEAWHPDTTVVFDWPQQAPSGSKIRTDWTALDKLELWQVYRDHWCDHNPSVTVNVAEEEWPEVASWCWARWDKMTGITFLPHDGGSYVQAPYESLDDDSFDDLVMKSPKEIDWSRLSAYELEDQTESARELACSAGVCSI